jgi:two-component system, NarL family, captular synthesis response regulator RcsB
LKLRVVIADDHPFVLLGLKSLFNSSESIEVVGEATNARELLTILAQQPCDVVVTDFAMPEPGLDAQDGLRLIREVRSSRPDLPIVVLTSVSNVAILRSVLFAGAASSVPRS